MATTGLFLAAASLLGLQPVAAVDLKILPAEVSLTGTHACQRLIVLAEADGQYVGDRTNLAQFVSSNPAVATVDEAGVVRASADGDAVVTASHRGKQTTARVKVA